MPKVIRKLKDLTPDSRNANRHTERGTGLLEQSLRKLGAGRSILVDRNGVVIAGNAALESAAAIGLEDVAVVQTDGRRLVVVQRTDLDLDRDKRARELAIADNRIGEVNLDWDVEQLTDTMLDSFEIRGLFRAEEIDELIDQAKEKERRTTVSMVKKHRCPKCGHEWQE